VGQFAFRQKGANELSPGEPTTSKSGVSRAPGFWHASCLLPVMRNPLLLTSAITYLALTACGGSNEPAKSAEDSEHAAEKAEDRADKAEDRADKAEDKASDAASDANKAENEK
jgi:hypothetical protein